MWGKGKAIALVNVAVSIWSFSATLRYFTWPPHTSLSTSSLPPPNPILTVSTFLALALPFMLAIDAIWCWSGHSKAYFMGAVASASICLVLVVLYDIPPSFISPPERLYLLLAITFSAFGSLGNVLVWRRFQKH